MFPARDRGHIPPNQKFAFLSGGRFQQPQMPNNFDFRSNLSQMSPMGMSSPHRSMLRPYMNVRMPNQHNQVGNYNTNRGQKRHNDEIINNHDKRARPSSNVPLPSITSIQSPPSSSVDNFVVPVSKGTEQITVAIWDYFLSARMDDEDLKKKLHLRKCLLSIFDGAFPNCRLFIVGSSMTGFGTKTSDVDMCLMISETEIDQRREATLILNSLSRAVRQCSSVQTLRVIKAKVPILKFFDNVMGVECDLNINNLIGVRNTHLLRFYAYMDWRVRPLMLFIKRWARFHDINDASKQTISSYSLTLMLIHYLQIGINPPVLPCLQKMRPDLFDSKTDVRKISLKFNHEINFTSKNRATLGELFIGFLNYYSNIFVFDKHVISVRLGGILSFEEASRGRGSGMEWKHLNIEEPFERTNTARSVYDKFVFLRIMRVFKSSFQTLERSRDVESILTRPF